MTIQQATTAYETWLGKQIPLLPVDLEAKHTAMTSALFPFFRATFYRWMQLWNDGGGDLRKAPVVLAGGDIHVENFGTWRDAEGRLVWGMNDFDEAFPLPYTLDLVRLATSAHIAANSSRLAARPQGMCEALLAGYTECLTSGGRPFVLAEDHAWLRKSATGGLRDPARFAEKLKLLPEAKNVPPSAIKALESMLPAKKLKYRVAKRTSGLGSLGRERFVAIVDWKGGQIAREAKALAPSACVWAGKTADGAKVHYKQVLDTAVRDLDPMVAMNGRWLVRRLAPDCSRIALEDLGAERDELKLLHSMGWETANIHLGTPKIAAKILADVKKRPTDWLHQAAEAMLDLTTADWKAWRKKK
jgi:Uncharacterized protein conserved in bacteria (DUF2252)